MTFILDPFRFGLPPESDPNAGRAYLPPVNDPDLYPLDVTYGDEFDDETLNAAWTIRNIAGGDINFPVVDSPIKVTFDASGDALLQDAPAGDFEIVARYGGINDAINSIGICILDSAGTGVATSIYSGGNIYIWNVLTYAYASNGPNITPGNNFDQSWLTLRKVGTNYTARLSKDGTTFSGFTASQSWAGTPAKIGWIRLHGNATYAYIYRFNVLIPTYTP